MSLELFTMIELAILSLYADRCSILVFGMWRSTLQAENIEHLLHVIRRSVDMCDIYVLSTSTACIHLLYADILHMVYALYFVVFCCSLLQVDVPKLWRITLLEQDQWIKSDEYGYVDHIQISINDSGNNQIATVAFACITTYCIRHIVNKDHYDGDNTMTMYLYMFYMWQYNRHDG